MLHNNWFSIFDLFCRLRYIFMDSIFSQELCSWVVVLRSHWFYMCAEKCFGFGFFLGLFFWGFFPPPYNLNFTCCITDQWLRGVCTVKVIICFCPHKSCFNDSYLCWYNRSKWKTSGYCQCWMNNWTFILSSFFLSLIPLLIEMSSYFWFCLQDYFCHLFFCRSVESKWIITIMKLYTSIGFWTVSLFLHQIKSNFLTGGAFWLPDPRTNIVLVS